MNREKRDPDYPVELETQFIMRMPETPGKALSELIKSGENFKNRLTIQIENDMRHGEVRFDQWVLHAKIVDLPTIVESWKTIDRKSLYKTADLCQLMICKEEADSCTEEESPTKNKKKDPLKVDKKFLWAHGITPPTKNVRKRRFRKTLRKKCTEGPEIEKEVKRLLRADNEAVSFTWEVIKEEDETPKVSKNEATLPKVEKGKSKKDTTHTTPKTNQPSKVEDIFGDALSDSDVEEENISVDVEDSRLSFYEEPLSENNSINAGDISKGSSFATQFKSEMFESPPKMSSANRNQSTKYDSKQSGEQSSSSYPNTSSSFKMQELFTELEELKQRRQRTQLEIAGMENMTLRQRFQDILKTLNKEIITKEVEYNRLKSHLK
ncbi:transcription initiation factor TFIID subunit 7-like [Danaus plexippus]|uniref:transcription initiation factor TFIID subunit 7-like n=1 Tax=Danaus plexippus TaxID=13037 RepID=UPI002AB231D8|nr:transcription initiation factor TFIID subunit 7-like [Danaus plexippus]